MKTFLTIAAAVVVALAVQSFLPAGKGSETTSTQPAYDRVIKTNTLRCAYALYPPFISKDPNTGKLSGLMVDVMDEFEKASGLKVEWGPEIDWGNIAPTLQTGKADAFCAGMAMSPKRGRIIAGTTPLYYVTLTAYVRPNDTRFDNQPERINAPDVRISANEGDMSEECAQRMFPKAQRVYKGALGGEDALFLNVATNKADVVLSAPSNLSTFNKNSPEMALRKIELKTNLIAFPGVIGVELHEQGLLSVINATIHNLIDTHVVDRILKANLGADYGTSYYPAKPQFE